MATRTISNTGGNWSSTSAWAEGAVPTSADDVVATATSGNLTIDLAASCRSIDMTNYVVTLTHAAAVTLSIGTTTVNASAIALKFVAGMTYTLGNATTSAITFVSTSTTQQSMTTAGKTFGNITFNGTGGVWQLADALTSNGNITLTAGTFNTNSKSVSASGFNVTSSTAKTLTLGSTTMTLSANAARPFDAFGSSPTNLTVTANTATLQNTITGAGFGLGTFNYNGISCVNSGGGNIYTTGATIGSLTVTGSNAKTNTLGIQGALTVTGTLTLAGNSTTNRILVTTDVLGTQRTITNTGATMTWSNVDFRDIGLSSAYDASAITGGSGDCGGNSGITFTTSATQNWTNTAGGSWSTSGNWSGRVPLPQDDVTFNCLFQSAKTVTLDMPRACRTMDWTDATFTTTKPTLSQTVSTTFYGSFTLTSNVTYSRTGASGVFMAGRSVGMPVGGWILTTAGANLWFVDIQAVGATVALGDALNMSSVMSFGAGTFSALSFGVSGLSQLIADVPIIAGTTVNLGSGSWIFTGSGTVLNASNLTINAETSTIVLAFTGSSSIAFGGGSKTYNNLSITGGGTGVVTISGSNTFATLTINAPKSVTFTSGTTQTVSSFVAFGSTGNIITINSSSSGTAATLSKSSGTVSCDYLSLKDSTATGGATWFAGSHSTNVSGNTGWQFISFVFQAISAATATNSATLVRSMATALSGVTTAATGTITAGFFRVRNLVGAMSQAAGAILRSTGHAETSASAPLQGKNVVLVSKIHSSVMVDWAGNAVRRVSKQVASSTATFTTTIGYVQALLFRLNAAMSSMVAQRSANIQHDEKGTMAQMAAGITKRFMTLVNAATQAFSGTAVVERVRLVLVSLNASMNACMAVLGNVRSILQGAPVQKWRVMVVKPEARTLTVKPENRTMIVPKRRE